MPGKIRKIKSKNLGSYPYFTVVLSITLALFVIGLFSLLILHANKLSDIIKDKFEVHAYLDKNLSEAKVDSIRNAIVRHPFVLQKENQSQIRFISKEQAAEKFIKETGEDFYKVLGDNPLRASFTIKIDHKYADSLNLKKVKANLIGINGIYEVDYKESLITQINKNISKISFLLILFSIILLITSILLINNTIKLALFSQRFLIRSMQLVGATKSFIQKPFLIRAAYQGFLSGIISSVGLLLMLQYLYSRVEELQVLSDTRSIAAIFGIIVLLGIIIGLLSSFRAVRKYLNLSLDELY